jgi:hypothetical protein
VQVGGYAIDYELPGRKDDDDTATEPGTGAGTDLPGNVAQGTGTEGQAAGRAAHQEVADSTLPHTIMPASASAITSRRSLLRRSQDDVSKDPIQTSQGTQEGVHMHQRCTDGGKQRGSFTFTTVRGAGHMVSCTTGSG